MSEIFNKIEEFNKQITAGRTMLMLLLFEIIKDKNHTLKEDVYITDEESGVRLKAISCTSHYITLEDKSIIDVGDIGTDDLLSLVETLCREKSSN